MSIGDRSARRRDAYAKSKKERGRSPLRRSASQSGKPSQDAMRSRKRRILGEMPDVRRSAERSQQKRKCDHRTSANRTASNVKADRRTSASRTAAKKQADYSGCVDRTREGRDVARTFELPACTFAPNSVGGDCFFLCIETATGHSVHSQRVILPLAMTEGDLALYRHLIG